jgi:DNA-binding transcriptional LysR family regulator
MPLDERISRRLKLRDLDTLRVIAEVGSMAKAAERLAVTQPAISKTMADLEHTLGVPLLDRTSRGVEITRYGQALLKHGAAVFDGLRQGLAEIAFLRDPTQGELRVGATEPVTAVLSGIINELLSFLPKLRFQVMVGDTSLLLDALRDRQLDVAFTRLVEPDAGPDLQTDVLFQDPLVVVAGARNPWTRRKKVDLSDLVDEPWVLPPSDTVLGRFGVEIFRVRGLVPPQTSVVTPSLPMRVSWMSEIAKERGRSAEPLVRQRLADVYTRKVVLDVLNQRIQTKLLSGQIPEAEGSVIKILMAQLGTASATTAIELLGADGTLADGQGSPQQRFLGMASLHIGGGTDEVQRNAIAERVLGLPREARPDKEVPFKDTRRS